ncbi:MAG TPA: two-component regulator propeller domain-containing protein, partial [Verrucomicrobiae bacterium]|nr:two-component regulator propeller domain-containing protein [Verrucomicrobiae bacterium]
MLCSRAETSAWASVSTSAPVQYHVRTWQAEEGLPQDAVQALAQTRDGYLWVGTKKGLARFDGVHFKVFDPQNTPELRNASITALLQSADGSLWIGTAGGGLVQMKDDKFFFHDLSGEIRGNTAKTFLQARDGTLWVGTLDGLFKMQDGHWTHLTRPDTRNVIISLEQSDDQLWIGTATGVSVLRNGSFSEMKEIGDRARTIYKDRDGTIWFGLTAGLGCLPRNGVFKFYTRKDGLPDNIVSAIFQDKRGDLWIGTYSGLCRFRDGKFITELDSLGTFYDQVNVITEDQEGDIWVGTRDGLHELKVKRFLTYTRQNGLAHNNILSVLEDHKGNIWLGTWGGGVSRLNEEGIVNFNWQNSLANGLTSDLILSLCEDKDGSLLIGTDYEGGTFRMEGNSFKRVWDQKQAAVDRIIRVIYRD